MAVKKKTVVTKSKPIGTRMSKPLPSKTAKTPEPVHKAPAPPPPGAKQRAAFDSAMKFFHARKFKDARDHFQDAATGPERDVAQRARVHIAMCERRLQHASVQLASPEEYYNYGIALLNARNIPEARATLEKALELSPGSDHVHYAVALAMALSGELNGAYENLKRAIELEPRNRQIARQDPDFAGFVNHPPFNILLQADKKPW
jgi:tetratricopeptide (TPR) repeat protein